MRLLLITTVASLGLAGCVGTYDKEADANLCETSMPTSGAAARQFFPLNNVNVPTRSLLGSGKTDPDDTMTYACIDAKNNKTGVPQVPNFHKIRLDHLSAI